MLDLTLPFTWTKHLRKPKAISALQKVCTGFDQAKDGDILAVVQRITGRKELTFNAVTEFITKKEDEKGIRFGTQSFSQLSDDMKSRIAVEMMSYQEVAEPFPRLFDLMEPIRDTEEVDPIYMLYLTPYSIMAAEADFQIMRVDPAIENDPQGRSLAQEHVDNGLRMFAEYAPKESGHEKITRLSRLQMDAKLYTSMYWVRDSNDIFHKLKTPDFTQSFGDQK